jgi:hypothetical protein
MIYSIIFMLIFLIESNSIPTKVINLILNFKSIFIIILSVLIYNRDQRLSYLNIKINKMLYLYKVLHKRLKVLYH